MKRVALSLFLFAFSALAAAQVVTPRLANEDGSSGGGCPDAAAVATQLAPADTGRPDDVPVPAAAAAAAEVPAKTTPVRGGTPGVRAKPGMRWHSFLPGMMK